VRGPAFSIAAQGSVGGIYYSHHHGNTYAYKTGEKAPAIPTEKQQIIIAKFVKAQEYWQGFDPRIRFIFKYLADNKPIYINKDCKRARPEPRNMWTRIAFTEVPDAVFWTSLAAVVAYVIAQYGWVLLFF